MAKQLEKNMDKKILAMQNKLDLNDLSKIHTDIHNESDQLNDHIGGRSTLIFGTGRQQPGQQSLMTNELMLNESNAHFFDQIHHLSSEEGLFFRKQPGGNNEGGYTARFEGNLSFQRGFEGQLQPTEGTNDIRLEELLQQNREQGEIPLPVPVQVQEQNSDQFQTKKKKEKSIKKEKKKNQKKQTNKSTDEIEKIKQSMKSRTNMMDDENMKKSMASHSSIRSSYGTQFVREILNQRRVPHVAHSLRIIQIIFLASFSIVILFNIFNMSGQISSISSDLNHFELFSNLTNSYSKGLLALVGLRCIDTHLITDSTQELYINYLNEASSSFSQAYQQIPSVAVVDSSSKETPLQDFNFLGQPKSVRGSTPMTLYQSVRDSLRSASDSLSLSSSFASQQTARVSYLFLRYNYDNFMDLMNEMKGNQDQLLTYDLERIQQVYIIATLLSCLLCIVVVVASIPIIQRINFYQEKILLLVTRISLQEVDHELNKYKQCIFELQSPNETYLQTDFLQIFTSTRSSSKTEQEKIEADEKAARKHAKQTQINYIISMAIQKEKEDKQNADKLQIESPLKVSEEIPSFKQEGTLKNKAHKLTDQSMKKNTLDIEYVKEKKSTLFSDRDDEREENVMSTDKEKFQKSNFKEESELHKMDTKGSKMSKGSKGDKQLPKNNSKVSKSVLSKITKFSHNTKKMKQNVMSSKIFESKLSFISRFYIFLFISIISVIFLLTMLVNVIMSNQSITPSINVSRASLSTQYSLGSYFIHSELLAVEELISRTDIYYPQVTLESRHQLSDSFDNDLKVINSFQEQNMNGIYSSNIISPSLLHILTAIYESDLCTAVPQYSNCNDFKEGLSGIISNIIILKTSHLSIFQPEKFPPLDLAIDYLTSTDHIKLISHSYLAPYAAFTLFSNILLQANSIVLQNMANLLIIVFSSAGPFILLILALFFLQQWKNLKAQFESLHFLLILIPEQKISEEATLHILKTLKTF